MTKHNPIHGKHFAVPVVMIVHAADAADAEEIANEALTQVLNDDDVPQTLLIAQTVCGTSLFVEPGGRTEILPMPTQEVPNDAVAACVACEMEEDFDEEARDHSTERPVSTFDKVPDAAIDPSRIMM